MPGKVMNMELVDTGVKCTPKEFEELKSLVAAGWRVGAPMICFSVLEGINRDAATVDAGRVCHALALKHGLPEITGYYGIDNDGQFVRT